MRTLIIIEDDQNLREGLELLFQIEGYRAIGASNGQKGIDLVRSERPDVVVTNFQMPGADGFDVLQAIRRDRDLADTPIVFLTADHQPSIRERAVRDGADAFLTKPFRTEELLQTVAALAAHANQES